MMAMEEMVRRRVVLAGKEPMLRNWGRSAQLKAVVPTVECNLVGTTSLKEEWDGGAREVTLRFRSSELETANTAGLLGRNGPRDDQVRFHQCQTQTKE